MADEQNPNNVTTPAQPGAPAAPLRVVPPSGVLPPLPTTTIVLPDNIAGKRLKALRNCNAIRWCTRGRTLPEIAQLIAPFACIFKAAVEGEGTEEADAARALYLEVFPGNETVYDAATPEDVTFFHLEQYGLPEEVAGSGRSPLEEVYRAIFAAALPEGISPTHAVACRILRLDKNIMGGPLGYNEMRYKITIGGRDMIDNDINVAREKIQNRIICPGGKGRRDSSLALTFGTLEDAVKQIARENTYHPIQRYLDTNAPWDGVPRLNQAVSVLLNANPSPLNIKMFRKFMISCIARAKRPGCKVDTMLILYGPQGFMKSSFFRTIAGEDFFCDMALDFDNKDHLIVMHRAWIYEWPELASLLNARAEESVKAGLTRVMDVYRSPYDHNDQDYPRSCVFAGTTNKKEILADMTGNRRYWILEVTAQINIAMVAAWRDQLWAEALAAYEAGEAWHLEEDDEKLLAVIQEDYAQMDEWGVPITEWLRTHPGAHNLSEIAKEALGISIDKIKHFEQNRITKILRKEGYDNKKVRTTTGAARMWTK